MRVPLSFFSDPELSWLYWTLALASGEGSGTPLQYSCLDNPKDAVW